MNGKVVSTLAICAAVIAAAVAGVVVMNNRAAIARANAMRAESEEAAAASAAKKARADESAALANAAAAENSAKAAAENRMAKEAEREKERLAVERAKEESAKAASDAEIAKAKAREAADARAAEKAKADAAKAALDQTNAVAKVEASRAQAAADALERERLEVEKVLAEARIYEAKQIDLMSLERELIEWQRDLDEREAALRPEMTSADLTWVGGRDADVIGGESNRVRRVAKPLPENDMTLPRETRMLARAERLKAEDEAVMANVSSNAMVSVLERLYIKAVREDRVVDADYYLKSIRMYYPNWRYSPKKEENQQ